MMLWETWKKGFDTWENTTAEFLEKVLKMPLVTAPAGKVLDVVMKVKAGGDKVMAGSWGLVGLSTRREQEKTLHALNQIQSQLLDLEEKLAESRQQ